MIEKLNETVAFLKKEGIHNPEIGIVLGTGLGDLVHSITIEKEIPYQDIPHFPISTMEFHSGKLIYGTFEGKKVLVMQGRFHAYEGYSFHEITYPIRALKLLGVSYLLLSNAAGSINSAFKKGTLMLIDDHINLQGGSPLIGKEIADLGNRFVDMIEPYSKKLNTQLTNIAKTNKITLHSGVYIAVSGPQLETRAEYRYLKIIGADAVGMSTVPEVIVANHIDLPCVAISVLTDDCDPDNLKPINIPEILELAKKAEPQLTLLYRSLIKSL